MEALKQIDDIVKTQFVEKTALNLSLSDQILRKWAISANNTLGDNKIMDFKASKNWVTAFKKRHRIVSRKITKFISKTHFLNLEKIKSESVKFVEDVREFLSENVSVRNVLNADQSGFELKLHQKRSLAPIGTKLVECVVQSVSSTTHSYTIMPIITADGMLLSPLYIVIAERQGKFLQKGIFQAKNVFAVPNTTHIMTKNLMIDWVHNVLLPVLRPGEQSLLLVDSWNGWNDFRLPDSVKLKVKQIPKHATGIYQPLDVYIFRIWRQFTRKITEFVMIYDVKINLHDRDNIVKLQSLIHNQFQTEGFHGWINFAWRKSGYYGDEPLPNFCHPVKFCFKCQKMTYVRN